MLPGILNESFVSGIVKRGKKRSLGDRMKMNSKGINVTAYKYDIFKVVRKASISSGHINKDNEARLKEVIISMTLIPIHSNGTHSLRASVFPL